MSGCFGYVAFLPDDCKNETPTANARVLEGWQNYPPSKWQKNPSSILSTRADFIRAWGEPTIIESSDDTEIWVYKRHLWCGVVPAFFIPVPLLLPVCDGFERIEFQDDYAKRLHIRRILEKGFIIGIGGFFSTNDPVCRYPLPNNSR